MANMTSLYVFFEYGNYLPCPKLKMSSRGAFFLCPCAGRNVSDRPRNCLVPAGVQLGADFLFGMLPSFPYGQHEALQPFLMDVRKYEDVFQFLPFGKAAGDMAELFGRD